MVILTVRLIFRILLLTNRQVANLRKAFANNLSANIKLSKNQLSKTIETGGFLVKLLGSLLKIGLQLMKNVLQPLAKSVLIQLGLTAAESAADERIHKKILGLGTTTLIISIEEIKEYLKIVIFLEESGLLTYFDSFGVEHIPKEIKKIIGNKNITTNIYCMQAYDSVMCAYFCIGFIDFTLKGKRLENLINLFSPNNV